MLATNSTTSSGSACASQQYRLTRYAFRFGVIRSVAARAHASPAGICPEAGLLVSDTFLATSLPTFSSNCCICCIGCLTAEVLFG
jgi:hypothetical protein